MSFEFQLVLTEKCNLACKYCYIKQSPLDMTKEIFDKHYKMLPEMMKKYGQTEYHAALFGGEPMLNWDLIEYIVPILRNDPKCTLIIAMTNLIPLLDDKKRQYILDNDVQLSISFDGLWNENNRVDHKGNSTLKYYTQDPLYSFITKRGNSCKTIISPDSVPTMTENFVWFVEKFGINNPDFSLVRDDIWSNDDVEVYDKECTRLADKIIEYYQNGINATVGLFQLYALDLLFGKGFGKRPFGCFAGCNGAGFMPDGKIYPCARFGSNKKLILGDSCSKGWNQENITFMNQPKVCNPRTYDTCNDCELYLYCNAGCTFEQINNGKNGCAEPIENVCKLLKITYRETMRMTNVLKDNALYKQMLQNIIKNVG